MNSHDRVSIASFPRSGNTMMRLYLEKLTDLHTGSDMDSSEFFGSVLKKEFKMEGDVEQTFIKTHYPFTQNPKLKFNTNKIILIVREPCAVIDSCYNLMMTNSHNDTLKNDYNNDYNYFFDVTLKAYNAYIGYWLNNKIPTIVIRYEDFMNDKITQLNRLCDFLKIDSSNIDKIPKENLYNYSLRKNKKKLNYSLLKDKEISNINQVGYFYKKNYELILSDIFVEKFNENNYTEPCKECGHIKEEKTMVINENNLNELYIMVDSKIFHYMKEHISKVLKYNDFKDANLRNYVTQTLNTILTGDYLENDSRIIKYSFFWSSWKMLFNPDYISETTGTVRTTKYI
jgi:hypothetical protein